MAASMWAGRVDMDYAFIGAALGFVLAIAEFVGLMWLAFRIDSRVDSATAGTTACLLRLVAVLGLAFSTGVGYLIGRWWGG